MLFLFADLANELERRSEESELQRERISHLENALARYVTEYCACLWCATLEIYGIFG